MRTPRVAIAVVAGYVGIVYAGVLINLIDPALLGPYYLRPVWSFFLLSLIVLALVNITNYGARNDRLKTLEIELHRTTAEIARLQETVNWLLNQLMAAGVSVPLGIGNRLLKSDQPAQTAQRVVMGVWPDRADLSSIDGQSEKESVRRMGLRYHVLNGEVTKERLLREWKSVRPMIVHVGAHATTTGIELSDGLSTVGYWAGLARRFDTKLVVLNACESLDIADAMHDAGADSVVGMMDVIKDATALEFTASFYRWLSGGSTVKEAVDLSTLSLDGSGDLIVARGDWSIQQ
ncbi:MAG: CHAT domain-containing protein [Caldilineaceae bacterium]|nr:CHAT domain-containing protein [Caldilineaceae bacterium]